MPEESKRLPGKPVRPEHAEKKVRPVKAEEPKTAEKKENAEKPAEAKPRISRFTKVLIFWLILLTVVIAGGLVWFNGFLGKYEELYQASLPYHIADNAIQLFANQDLDGIWALVKDKTTLTEFENETTIKNYIKGVISNREFTYQPTENYAENAPEYYIISGKEIIAKLKLGEDATQNPPYGFKSWKTDELEFYSSADHKLKITMPEGYKLTINGIDVPVSYKTEQDIEPEENKYLKPHAELPKMCVYEASGLYAEPVVKVTDSDGKKSKPNWIRPPANIKSITVMNALIKTRRPSRNSVFPSPRILQTSFRRMRETTLSTSIFRRIPRL